MSGKLIVFEGTDGSGKATQTRLLAARLKELDVAFREIDFPRYGNPFAEPARLYLSGALGRKPGRERLRRVHAVRRGPVRLL